jgi:hypothetical protein
MATSRSALSLSLIFVPCVAATCALAQSGPSATSLPTQPLGASPPELRILGGSTDYSVVHPQKASPQELPTWRIPSTLEGSLSPG